MQHEHAIAESSQEKANMLKYHSSSTECSDDILSTESQILYHWILTKQVVQTGYITPIMLKCTAHSMLPSLTTNNNLDQFQKLWKMSSVMPILKLSNHNEASDYRPTSLSPLLNKVIEHHLLSLITEHITEARQLSNNQ